MTGTALAFPTPASLGSLDHYIQAVNRFPLLTAEQETALGRRLKEHEDIDAARELVLSHLRLVVAVSRNYLGYGLPQADLIQEGNVGLMKAVRRFDPERGVRLVSFALHWIRAEMHEYILRNWRLVKLATTKAQRKLFFNLRSMKGSSAALTHTEAKAIAHELGVKPEEVLEMETRISGGDVALDPSPGDEDTVTPIAYLTDAEDEPALILERAEASRNRSVGLQRAMAKLDERSRRIIEARWLKEEDPATLQELADEYGVSAERIRQIESKAIKTMRNQMAATDESFAR
jgi:RNA polymerase sigma-32 factor